MKKFLYVLFAIIAIAACSKSDDIGGGNNNNNETPKQPEITLDATSSDFTTDGGSNVITFNSNVAWTAEVVNTRADAWCSINPTSGPAGTANITVTTKENDTPDEWDEGVFANEHDKLKTINLNANLTKILPYMFSKTEAANVWIPHTVTSIGNYAFYDCDNLLGVTMGYDGTTDFPSIGTGVFDNCDNFSYTNS